MPPTIWKTSTGIQTPLRIQSESDVEVTIGTDVDIVMNGNLRNVITLNCSLHHRALPNANFTWTRNDQPINGTDMIEITYLSENGSLLVIHVTQSTDEAQFNICCKAESIVARDNACSELRITICEYTF